MTVTPIERPTAGSPGGGRRRRRRADAPVALPAFRRTDLGNAERLVARHGADLLHLRGQWYVWDGTRYRIDHTGATERRAKETVRSIWLEAKAAAESEAEDAPVKAKALGKHAADSESRRALSAMVSLAASELDVIVDQADELDADPWLFNCPNGTVDLRTGELREHDRAHRITRRAGVDYDPDAPAPTWDAFLARILPDPAVREFVQRIVGYTLTGLTSEEKLFFLNGGGANGKSTLIDAVCLIMGEYGMPAPPDLLLSKRPGAPSNDVAALRGTRLASASETEDGARLDEVRTKALVTGDKQSARFLHKEFFEFRPVAKYWIATNHRPVVRGSDEAIWRRMVLVPFEAFIPPAERDRALAGKLRAEAPGILAWAVRGCLAWQRDGLTSPVAIQRATDGYRAEQDLIGQFLADECVLHESASTNATGLYSTYRMWCENTGENPQTQRRFGQRLGERSGLRKGRSGTVTWYGVGLRSVGTWNHLVAVVDDASAAAPAPAAEPEPAPDPAPAHDPSPAPGPCDTCAGPGPSCGVAVPVDAALLPCVLCGEPTRVRALCNAPRHAGCRPGPDDDRGPDDVGPTGGGLRPVPAPTAKAPRAAAPRPAGPFRRSAHTAARSDAQGAVLEEFRTALAEGRPLTFLAALEGPFEPRRRVDGRMTRPFWRPELPGCTWAVHAVEAWGWTRPYAGSAVVLDRSAAFLSAASSVLVAHGALENTGPLDSFDDRRPGYYQVQVHPWYETALPHPLLHTHKRETAWVTAPTVALLRDLEREGRWPDVTILDSYTSDGVRIDGWARFVNTIRAEAITVYGRDSEQYAEVKDRYSMAFQLMLGSANDGGRRRWKCGAQRPDWTQTVRAQAAANLYRWADACRKVAPAAPPIALRNTDELVIPAAALDVVTTAARPGGLSPLVIDPDGIKLGSFKVKHLDEWKGGK